MGTLVTALLLVNAVNLFGPPVSESKVAFAVSALMIYFVFAGAAHWLDGKRCHST